MIYRRNKDSNLHYCIFHNREGQEVENRKGEGIQNTWWQINWSKVVDDIEGNMSLNRSRCEGKILNWILKRVGFNWL